MTPFRLIPALRAVGAFLATLIRRVRAHRIGLAAAGCAFYATLALFPAASMMISIYGLAFDRATIAPQLDLLQPLLPPEAFTLITRLVDGLTAQPRGQLGLALIVGLAITFWSSAVGARSMLDALNIAHDHPERRSVLHFEATALAMTLTAVLGAILALALLVALPATLAFLHQPGATLVLARAVSFAVLLIYVSAMLAGLYRFGPSRRPSQRPRILPGTLAATLLWLAAAALFSLYAGGLATFDVTYGPLGAIATVMLWFWVSSYAVLVGAEINAVLEHRGA